jgi:hypothetical protein
MTDKLADSELTTDVLLADVLIRLTVLEKLLISKDVFSQEELTQLTQSLTEQISQAIVSKTKTVQSLDEFIQSLKTNVVPHA